MDNSTNLETNMHVRKGYMFVYVFDVCVCVFFFVVRAVDHHHHHHQQQIQPDLFIHAKCE